MTRSRALLHVIGYFRVVPPVPPLMMGTFGVTTCAAGLVVAVSPARAADALTPVLLLHLFAVSSGFMVPARRGHYDLLLTAGPGRLQVATVHWLMSAMPGIASWLLLALVERVATRGAGASLLASGTVAAIVIVSTLPWALTVRLPRFAGAIGWLVVLGILLVMVPSPGSAGLFERLGSGASWLEAAVALTIYPPVLVGEDLVGPHGFLVLPALFASVGSIAGALRWADRHDIPLEAAQ